MFVFTQVIQKSNITSVEEIKKKVKESLSQTRRDLSLFLEIFPDFTFEHLDKIKFSTLSILPATLSHYLNICLNCRKSIIFREDLNPHFKELESLAKNLNADIGQPHKSENMSSLKNKFHTTTIQQTTSEFLMS